MPLPIDGSRSTAPSQFVPEPARVTSIVALSGGAKRSTGAAAGASSSVSVTCIGSTLVTWMSPAGVAESVAPGPRVSIVMVGPVGVAAVVWLPVRSAPLTR